MQGATIKHIIIKDYKIPIVYEYNNNLPLYLLQLVFKNSGYKTDGNLSGLSKISADILNEGTKKDDVVVFNQKLDSKAISLHSSVGFETFVIEINSLSEQSDDAIIYLKELLYDPNIAKKTLDRLKAQKIGRLKAWENDFDIVANDGLKRLVFGNTPLSHNQNGTIKSIENIKLQDIKNKLNNTLSLDNLVVVAGGDIEIDKLKKQLTKLLTNFNTNKTKDNTKYISPTKIVKKQEILKDTKQSYIYFISPFDLEVTSKDYYKAKISSLILGGSGFGSRLMQTIRVKSGLAYSIYGGIAIEKSYSYFKGYLQCDIKNTDKSMKLIDKVLKDFVNDGVSQKELDSARDFYLGSQPLRAETLEQRLSRANLLYFNNLGIEYYKKEQKEIQKLTTIELNSFIKQHSEILKISYFIVTSKGDN